MSPSDAARTRGEATFFQPGTPTSQSPRVLATGDGGISAAVVTMSIRSPAGKDAEHIRWHQFDHMPEQYRVAQIRNGQRWVSTPACRAERRAEAEPFERADQVVQYLFAEPVLEGLAAFKELSIALTEAGRLPMPEWIRSGAYEVIDRRANPRGVVGADVLPWWPASGIYLLVELTPADSAARAAHAMALERLAAVDGVAGAWRYEAGARDLSPTPRREGETVTVFYLYEDPVGVAGPLGEALAREWAAAGTQPLLAAPFHVVRPHAWDQYLP